MQPQNKIKNQTQLQQDVTFKVEDASHPVSNPIFTFGLRVLSQPPLSNIAATLKTTVKETLLKKNFNKTP